MEALNPQPYYGLTSKQSNIPTKLEPIKTGNETGGISGTEAKTKDIYTSKDFNFDFNKRLPSYEKLQSAQEKLMQTRGLEDAAPDATARAALFRGNYYNSTINKIHFIRLENGIPGMESELLEGGFDAHRKFTSFVDLCQSAYGAQQYDPDDFLYCKHFGQPISHLITLRRFPTPCTDNIWDKENQNEPDIARMVTYFNQEVNKLDDILKFTYNLKWKELQSEMEQATMQGEQPGLVGNLGKIMQFVDPVMYKDIVRGENSYSMDPKYDQNKVYGPVDSIASTNIRDVGLEYNKEFELIFDYELRSINGRTPEFAMRDILANALACTYNNAKFWGGSRYWVGKRPSKYLEHFQWMNSGDMDKVLDGFRVGINDILTNIAGIAKGLMGGKSSALATLKSIFTGAAHLAMGKLLDKIGRPGIPMMNSLLSGEPTGFWHVTIGNPQNPTLCIGNLIITGVDINFPTDNLSFLEFPTKMQIVVKLKPGMPKDRAGIEMMFNAGKSRMYYTPKQLDVDDTGYMARKARRFYGFDSKALERLCSESYDFMPLESTQMGKSYKTTLYEKKVQVNKSTGQEEEIEDKSKPKEVEYGADYTKKFGSVKVSEPKSSASAGLSVGGSDGGGLGGWEKAWAIAEDLT